GNDTFFGGDGIDMVSYATQHWAPVSITLDGTANDGQVGETDYILTDVENAYGTPHGDASDDQLFGEIGSDLLYGGMGYDQLYGGDGQDTLVSIGGGNNDYNAGGADLDSFWIDNALYEQTDATPDE